MNMLIHGREFQIASLNEIHYKMVDKLKMMPKGKVLDFPAGTGRLSWMLYHEGRSDVAAADIGPEGFQNPEIPVVKGDLDSRFPFEDGTFDYACCVDVRACGKCLSYVPEFSRVLKKDGLFLMSYPNYSNIESRIRNVFYGILEPVEPYNPKDHKNNRPAISVVRPTRF